MATIENIGTEACAEAEVAGWGEDCTEERTMEFDEQLTAMKPGTGQWAIGADGGYDYVQAVAPVLPAGIYKIEASPGRGIYFDPIEIDGDELLPLPDPHTVRVLQSLEEFWGKKDLFHQFGFLWTRGILLYGPQGSGKSSTLRRASDLVVDRDGVVFYVYNPGLAIKGLQIFRKAEPDRKIIVVLEDVDNLIDYSEEELLSLLDGENQVDNVVFIATTNDLSEIPPRVRNRPRRFDDVIEIGMPDAAVRRSYFEIKNPRFANGKDAEELETWVRVTEGLSVAHLCEMVVAVELLNHDAMETGARLQFMKYLADEDLEEAMEMVENFLQQTVQTSPLKARQVAQAMIAKATEMAHAASIAMVSQAGQERPNAMQKVIDELDSVMGG